MVVGGRFSSLCDFPENRRPVTVSAAKIGVITADFRVSDRRIDVICGEIAVSSKNGVFEGPPLHAGVHAALVNACWSARPGQVCRYGRCAPMRMCAPGPTIGPGRRAADRSTDSDLLKGGRALCGEPPLEGFVGLPKAGLAGRHCLEEASGAL